MTSENHISDVLNNISESSLSGILQDFVERRDKSQPTVVILDAEGSDFKRLVNKKKKEQAPPLVTHSTPVNQFNKPTITRKASLYTRLFEHKDKYFNQDRKELSKDIFPVGMKTSSVN